MAQEVAQTARQKKNQAVTIRGNKGFTEAIADRYDIDEAMWDTLVSVVFPAAKTKGAILMALDYCEARDLDILKKMIHIVPMWSKRSGKMVETVWPGIAEVRATASRTSEYAGKDAVEFGPDREQQFTGRKQNYKTKQWHDTEETLVYPEWARLTVYRIVKGVRCAFVGPKVRWTETYATEGRDSDVPNEMWLKRPSGQLEKCCEAASLRAAFPEEMGSMYAAEEMAGQTIDMDPETGEILDPAGQPEGANGALDAFSEDHGSEEDGDVSEEDAGDVKDLGEADAKASEGEKAGDQEDEPEHEAEEAGGPSEAERLFSDAPDKGDAEALKADYLRDLKNAETRAKVLAVSNRYKAEISILFPPDKNEMIQATQRRLNEVGGKTNGAEEQTADEPDRR